MVTLSHTFQCFIEEDDMDFDEAVESAVLKTEIPDEQSHEKKPLSQ